MRGIVLLLVFGVGLLYVALVFLSPSSVEGAEGGETSAPSTLAVPDTESIPYANEPYVEDEGLAAIESEEVTPAVLDDDGAWLQRDEESDQIAEQERFVETQPAAPAEVAEEQPSAPIQLSTGRQNPSELGRLLIHSWVQQDPLPLQTYINSGAGADLSDAKRTLVSAFWQAMTGNAQEAAQTITDLRGAEDVTSEQVDLLVAAVEALRPRAQNAAHGRRRDPLALGMRMVLIDENARAAELKGQFALASSEYSELLLAEFDAPWTTQVDVLRVWGAAVNRVQGKHRLDPKGDWDAIDYEVRNGQSLIMIRKELVKTYPGLLMCTGWIKQANGLGEYIHPGDRLRIPTAKPSVRVDLDGRTLLYLQDNEVVRAYEVGIGKEGHETPVGEFIAGQKQERPSWMPKGRSPVPFGHPDNPLGTRWIAWLKDGVGTSYGIHGTSDPDGVGGRVSQGCVRMRNEDVEELFELLPDGTQVSVQL